MKEENIKVVESYIEAIGKKDLTFEMLADDVYFEDPMTVRNHGADNLRAFLKGFLAAINRRKNYRTYLRRKYCRHALGS